MWCDIVYIVTAVDFNEGIPKDAVLISNYQWDNEIMVTKLSGGPDILFHLKLTKHLFDLIPKYVIHGPSFYLLKKCFIVMEITMIKRKI